MHRLTWQCDMMHRLAGTKFDRTRLTSALPSPRPQRGQSPGSASDSGWLSSHPSGHLDIPKPPAGPSTHVQCIPKP
ncbi:unnamed protein product [Mycena citricolor]|uniref:Uncharacterized protein n=1 Tax=Mycena citricolor TaxID=2018698 RepID=A0AAD2JXQ1_9AGAR|nr:unnamed protein product [Mycena citricolor]